MGAPEYEGVGAGGEHRLDEPPHQLLRFGSVAFPPFDHVGQPGTGTFHHLHPSGVPDHQRGEAVGVERARRGEDADDLAAGLGRRRLDGRLHADEWDLGEIGHLSRSSASADAVLQAITIIFAPRSRSHAVIFSAPHSYFIGTLITVRRVCLVGHVQESLGR